MPYHSPSLSQPARQQALVEIGDLTLEELKQRLQSDIAAYTSLQNESSSALGEAHEVFISAASFVESQSNSLQSLCASLHGLPEDLAKQSNQAAAVDTSHRSMSRSTNYLLAPSYGQAISACKQENFAEAYRLMSVDLQKASKFSKDTSCLYTSTISAIKNVITQKLRCETLDAKDAAICLGILLKCGLDNMSCVKALLEAQLHVVNELVQEAVSIGHATQFQRAFRTVQRTVVLVHCLAGPLPAILVQDQSEGHHHGSAKLQVPLQAVRAEVLRFLESCAEQVGDGCDLLLEQGASCHDVAQAEIESAREGSSFSGLNFTTEERSYLGLPKQGVVSSSLAQGTVLSGDAADVLQQIITKRVNLLADKLSSIKLTGEELSDVLLANHNNSASWLGATQVSEGNEGLSKSAMDVKKAIESDVNVVHFCAVLASMESQESPIAQLAAASWDSSKHADSLFPSGLSRAVDCIAAELEDIKPLLLTHGNDCPSSLVAHRQLRQNRLQQQLSVLASELSAYLQKRALHDKLSLGLCTICSCGMASLWRIATQDAIVSGSSEQSVAGSQELMKCSQKVSEAWLSQMCDTVIFNSAKKWILGAAQRAAVPLLRAQLTQNGAADASASLNKDTYLPSTHMIGLLRSTSNIVTIFGGAGASIPGVQQLCGASIMKAVLKAFESSALAAGKEDASSAKLTKDGCTSLAIDLCFLESCTDITSLSARECSTQLWNAIQTLGDAVELDFVRRGCKAAIQLQCAKSANVLGFSNPEDLPAVPSSQVSKASLVSAPSQSVIKQLISKEGMHTRRVPMMPTLASAAPSSINMNGHENVSKSSFLPSASAITSGTGSSQVQAGIAQLTGLLGKWR